MKFKLFCDEDPVALGIKDANGNCYYLMFKEHVESCEKCKWLKMFYVHKLKDKLKARFIEGR